MDNVSKELTEEQRQIIQLRNVVMDQKILLRMCISDKPPTKHQIEKLIEQSKKVLDATEPDRN